MFMNNAGAMNLDKKSTSLFSLTSNWTLTFFQLWMQDPNLSSMSNCCDFFTNRNYKYFLNTVIKDIWKYYLCLTLFQIVAISRPAATIFKWFNKEAHIITHKTHKKHNYLKNTLISVFQDNWLTLLSYALVTWV